MSNFDLPAVLKDAIRITIEPDYSADFDLDPEAEIAAPLRKAWEASQWSYTILTVTNTLTGASDSLGACTFLETLENSGYGPITFFDDYSMIEDLSLTEFDALIEAEPHREAFKDLREYLEGYGMVDSVSDLGATITSLKAQVELLEGMIDAITPEPENNNF